MISQSVQYNFTSHPFTSVFFVDLILSASLYESIDLVYHFWSKKEEIEDVSRFPLSEESNSSKEKNPTQTVDVNV